MACRATRVSHDRNGDDWFDPWVNEMYRGRFGSEEFLVTT